MERTAKQEVDPPEKQHHSFAGAWREKIWVRTSQLLI